MKLMEIHTTEGKILGFGVKQKGGREAVAVTVETADGETYTDSVEGPAPNLRVGQRIVLEIVETHTRPFRALFMERKRLELNLVTGKNGADIGLRDVF